MKAQELIKKYQGESVYLHEDDAIAFAEELVALSTSNLIQLQSELKDTLFVRPCNIEDIEQAAVKLCDAIIENHEG